MLKINPQGGLFLMGGVTLALRDYIGKPEAGFLEAVYNKGRVSGMIQSIPIYILKREIGLDGAESYAL
mgnify:FL=1